MWLSQISEKEAGSMAQEIASNWNISISNGKECDAALQCHRYLVVISASTLFKIEVSDMRLCFPLSARSWTGLFDLTQTMDAYRFKARPTYRFKANFYHGTDGIVETI